jgi:hypothetical protein
LAATVKDQFRKAATGSSFKINSMAPRQHATVGVPRPAIIATGRSHTRPRPGPSCGDEPRNQNPQMSKARGGPGHGESGVRLNITKQQVQGLPPVDIDHPGG